MISLILYYFDNSTDYYRSIAFLIDILARALPQASIAAYYTPLPPPKAVAIACQMRFGLLMHCLYRHRGLYRPGSHMIIADHQAAFIPVLTLSQHSLLLYRHNAYPPWLQIHARPTTTCPLPSILNARAGYFDIIELFHYYL